MSILMKISVGIPAYNEANNIAHLLREILRQRFVGARLLEIIVYSDGSTDGTAEAVRSVKDGRIRLRENPSHEGLAYGLNAIFAEARGDVLVLLNGDISIPDQQCMVWLLEPIIAGEADLASGKILEFPPKNFLQRVLAVGVAFRRRVFERWQAGDNVYTCYGPLRAFSRRLYSQLRFPTSVGDDMYSYLYCVSRGYRYAHVRSAEAWYRLPSTLADHLRQSTRFFRSAASLAENFPEGFVSGRTRLPKALLLQEAAKAAILHPLRFSAYAFVTLLSKVAMRTGALRGAPQEWGIALSSKQLR